MFTLQTLMIRRIVRARCPPLMRTCPAAVLHIRPTLPIRKMATQLPTVEPPLSATLPSDSYQLLPTSAKSGSAEDALFDQQVEDVKQWWASSRYNGIKRPYSAEDVVSKRGTLQQTYPSSLMARKLFNLFRERAAAGEPVHTSELRRQRKFWRRDR